jgi:hypothetical protein
MPRIQILELPTIYRENGDDETPFALVIDQVGSADDVARLRTEVDGTKLAETVGARQVLVFQDTVDIPANDVTLIDGQVVRVHVEGDFTNFRQQAEDEIRKAQAVLQQTLR